MDNKLKPIIKYNGGLGAILCHRCKVIITTGFKSKELYCSNCKEKINNNEDMAYK